MTKSPKLDILAVMSHRPIKIKTKYESMPEQCEPDGRLSRRLKAQLELEKVDRPRFIKPRYPGEEPKIMHLSALDKIVQEVSEPPGMINPESAEVQAKIEEQARHMRDTGPNPDLPI